MLLTLASRAVAVVLGCLPLLAAPAAAAQWTPIGPHLATITDIEAAPSDPRVVYAATRGGGLYRSTDGGRSWARRNGSGATAQPDLNVLYVAVDPRAAATVYIGTYQSGLFKSVDGGGSWAPIARGVLSYVPGNAVVMVDPVRPRTLYAWYSYLFLRSADGGATWRRLNVPYDVRDVAASARAPQVQYAASLGGVYKSTNGGVAWALSNRGMENASVDRIAVDPRRPAELYAVGTRPGITGSAMFRSSDSGRTWRVSGRGLPAGSYFSVVVVDAQGTAYVGTPAGVYRSEDGGATWSARNQGLANHAGIPTIYSLAFNAADPDVLYAGADQAIFKSSDGGATWRRTVNAVEGFFNTRVRSLATSPDDPAVLYAAGGEVDFAVPFFLFLKSTDAGETWSPAGGETHAQRAAADPTDAQALLAYQGAALQRSTDGGATFAPVDIELPVGVGVTAVAFDPASPGVVHAAANGGGPEPVTLTFQSLDGGATWNPVDAGGIGNSNVLNLAIDDTGKLYAATRGGGVYRLDLP